MISILGYTAWKNIPIENAPELNLPSITVSYYWGGTSPEVVETEITRKVESAANKLRDVTRINSNTQEGRSSVSIQFSKNAPVEFRALELREYLHTLEQSLPPNVNPAQITRRIPEEIREQQTFMVYTLSGDVPARELLQYAGQSLQPKLTGLAGLADVKLLGVENPVLFVEFDRHELEKYGLSAPGIMMQLRNKLNWRSSGYIDMVGTRVSMTLPPEFENTADVANMRIEIPGSLKQLILSDIAKTRVGDYPSKSLRRINGSPALTIELIKESGTDAMMLARDILEIMAEVEKNLPADMDLLLQIDSTEQLRGQYDQLGEQAMFSAVLIFLVMLLFIRKIRAPFVIMGSVFFSVLMSLIVLYLSGYTLNVITMAGLTIALGMIIDNAVVVFEQVNTGLPKDKSRRLEHIKKELPRAVVPVLGSTFTTVGIFVPLLFALDDLRMFLIPLATALTTTLLSSVVIAFTWIPYSLVWLTPNIQFKQNRQKFRFASKLRRSFLLILIWRSKLRWVLLFALVATFGIPIFLIETPKWDENTRWPEFTKIYFDNRKEIDEWIGGVSYRFKRDIYFGSPWMSNTGENIYVNITTPQGTPIDEIDKLVRSFETIAKPYEEAFLYYEADMSEFYGARMVFSVNPDYFSRAEPYYFLGEAMYLAARSGNVATSVSGFGNAISTGYGGASSTYNIRLEGYSYDEVYDLAAEIGRRLTQNPRVKDLDINSSYSWFRDDFYQYELALDEEKLLATGLNRYELLNTLAIDINPENTYGRIEFEGQEMYLIGKTDAERYYEEDLIHRSRISNGTSFNLASIGEIKKEKALSEIRRTNQAYERVISLSFLGNYRMGNDYIESVLEQVPVPIGSLIDYNRSIFSSGLIGRNSEFDNMALIILLSILSVWMIISALLESWKSPLFVLSTIPFGFMGIMAGSLINAIYFDRGAIAGSLLCIGIVVNNAILFIHQRDLEKKDGIYGLRCWYNVFRKKMRTVLITTTTTIAGLLPMIYFGTDDFWQGLAVVVCWGLIFSTGLLFLLAGVHESRKISTKQ